MQRLIRGEQDHARQLRYRLGTTAIVGGVQRPLTPRDRGMTPGERALQFPTIDDMPALPNLGQVGPTLDRRVRLARGRSRRPARDTWSGNSPRRGNSNTASSASPAIPSRSDRGLRHQAPAGALRVFRHRPDADAPQRRDSGPRGLGVQVRRDGTRWAAITRSANGTPTPGSRPTSSPARSPRVAARRSITGIWETEGGWLRLDPTPGRRGPPRQSSLADPRRCGLARSGPGRIT